MLHSEKSRRLNQLHSVLIFRVIAIFTIVHLVMSLWKEESKMMGCGPRLVVIGSQKGGTTALASYMRGLSLIGLGWKKELHFFDRLVLQNQTHVMSDTRLMQQEYLKMFGMRVVSKEEHDAMNQEELGDGGMAHASPWRYCKDDRTNLVFRHKKQDNYVYADVTPMYVITPRAPEMIRSVANDPYILLLLREPYERALSEFRMNWRMNKGLRRTNATYFAFEFDRQVRLCIQFSQECILQLQQDPDSLSKESCLKRGMQSPVDLVWRGLYHIHLRRWFATFAQEKMIAWVSEKFSEDSLGHMVQLQTMLLEPKEAERHTHVLSSMKFPKVHKDRKRLDPWDSTRTLLKEFYHAHNHNLTELLHWHGHVKTVQDMRQSWQL